MMYTLPISSINSYVSKNIGGSVLKTEDTDSSIYCLYSKNNSSECGIVSFDKKPFQRCVRRTIAPSGQKKYASDFFQIGNDGKIFVSFVCGGLNSDKLKTCNVTINRTKYSKNIAKEPFLFVIEFYAPSQELKAPIIEFSN